MDPYNVLFAMLGAYKASTLFLKAPFNQWAPDRKRYFICWSILSVIAFAESFNLFGQGKVEDFFLGIFAVTLSLLPCGIEFLNQPPWRLIRNLVLLSCAAFAFYRALPSW